MNRTYLYFLPLFFLFTQSNLKQDKKKVVIPVADLPPKKIEQPAISASPTASPAPLVGLRLMLDEEFRESKRYAEKSADTTGKKQILSVAWIDENYDNVNSMGRGELISMAILTKGYTVGDTIRVTIGSQDDETQEDETTLVDDVPCHDITFIGIQNYEDMAVLKDIFTIEGEEEKMVIQPAWKERYECDAKKNKK